MDSKLTLVHCLMLLYWENQLDIKADGSSALVKETIEHIKLPDATLEVDSTREILISLRSTVFNLCSAPPEEKIDRMALLQRIRLNCKDDSNLYATIADAIYDCDDQIVIRQKCNEYSKLLHNAKKEKDFLDKIKKVTMDVLYGDRTNGLNVKQVAMDIQTLMEPFVIENTAKGVRGIAGVVDYIDYGNDEELAELFGIAQDEVALDGILKTGYQAINRMMGDYGGFRRGDMIAVGAFQHNYKTGFTLNLTRQIATYNTPYMLDPTKKPLIVHLSTENHSTDNLMLMYASIYENEYGVACDTRNVSKEEASKYVKERLGVNGYHFKALRVDPSEFTYQSLFSIIMELESEGYEIHLLTIDYLNMFNKAGCVQSFTGSDTRDLFRRVRNFCSKRKITVITPHQISTEAKVLLRQGVQYIVKELVGKSYWDSCKTLDQEIDVGMWIHIEKSDMRSYLAIARDKHRKSGAITPEVDLFTILPFHDIGAVKDDILGKDLSIRKLDTVGMGGSDW